MIDTILRREAEIDTRIAAAYEDYWQANHARQIQQERVRQMAEGWNWNNRTRLTYAKAKAMLERREGAHFRLGAEWEAKEADDALQKAYEAGLLAEEKREIYEQAETEYGGWQRFFLVTNTNGHIHATRACQTCFTTTQFAWLPGLSGLTEADAVAEHGPRLCTVCFPTAPVEWTEGIKKDYCAGKPTGEPRTYFTGRRMTTYWMCDECGEQVAETASGALRKHKPKKK